MNNVRVAVCLVTYNQEKYIEQAINSVLLQQTTFPVDIVVGNDCSIDSTAEVLQRILENTRRVNGGVIVFNRLNNLGIVGNTIDLFRYIIEQDYTYVAMLDGDDWWCDENKLQMQVELMEKNKDVSFCYMRGTSDEKLAKNHRDRDTNHIRIKDMFDEIRHTGIANGTVVHRVSMLRKVPFDKIFGQNLLSLDYPTNVYMARQGKVAFIDHISLFWRRTGNTTSSAASKEKAYRYIDHEVRQGLFLSSEFPNTSYAFSKLNVPIGSNISPVGPKLKATNLGFVLSHSSTAFFAIFTALSTISSTLYLVFSNLISFAPNVLVVITSDPASKYNLCILRSLSGFSNPNTSVFSPLFRPFCCSIVPIAPSNSSILLFM